MRAFKFTDPTKFVYWVSNNEPDKEGNLAPVPSGELRDIIVQSVYYA